MPGSATTAYASALTKLEVLSASPSTWLEIVQSTGWTGPSANLALEDITNLSSTEGSIEKFPISKEVSVMSSTLIYDPSNAAHIYLRTSNATWPPRLELFKFTTSAGHVSMFDAYVSKFEQDHKAKAVARINIELTPTGALAIVS